jgi:hypothetical protein
MTKRDARESISLLLVFIRVDSWLKEPK